VTSGAVWVWTGSKSSGAFVLERRGNMIEGIVKENGANGEAMYRFPNGEEILTYPDTLFDAADLGLIHLKAILAVIDEHYEEDDCMPSIAEIVIKDLEQDLYEMHTFIRNHFGRVGVVRACYHQEGIKPETIIDVEYEPAETEDEEDKKKREILETATRIFNAGVPEVAERFLAEANEKLKKEAPETEPSGQGLTSKGLS
jgi:hypothetical protein